jgi:ribosomal protein S18 acetylase RimI-like enzyme
VALRQVREEVSEIGIVALHLEVERSNERARRLYQKWGFEARERFQMMSCRLA